MIKICVLGDSGLLGQALTWAFSSGDYQVLGVSSGDFAGNPYRPAAASKYRHQKSDVLKNKDDFFSVLDSFKPELLINCAALVDLALCEKEPELAKALNTELVGALAGFTFSNNIHFIQISTDQVFDGKKKSPYSEKDPVNPLHAYGRTKLLGEKKAFEKNADSLVIRTNIVGFRDRKDQPTFVEWLIRALQKKESITLAEDFVTSSVHVDAISSWIVKAHELGLKGLYHMASKDSASKLEFGRQLAKDAGLDFGAVKKGRLSDLNLKPERAPYLALDVAKAEENLHLSFEKTADTVKRLAKDFQLRARKEKNG